jgi:N-acetyl-anhydromuramyl-L-alanine amidase AmpD
MKTIAKPCTSFRHNRNGTPWILVYHYGATFTADATYKALEARKVSSHGTLDLDGTLYQQVRDEDTAWHAGESTWAGSVDINDDSIGLEIVNVGFGDPIPKGTDTRGWYLASTQKGRPLTAFRVETYKDTTGATKKTYVGIAEPMSVFPDHRPAWQGKLWAQYTAAQLEALKEYQRQKVLRWGILPEAIVGHEHIAPGRKTDPGPAFQPLWDALAADYIAMAAAKPELLDPNFQKELRVKCLQSHLKRLGVYRLRVDGSAGDGTAAAVIEAIRLFGPTYGFAGLNPKSTTIDLCHAFRKVPGFDPPR